MADDRADPGPNPHSADPGPNAGSDVLAKTLAGEDPAYARQLLGELSEANPVLRP